MELNGITTKCFILALFIRSDGERFLLGDEPYSFRESQQHFQANTMSNDVVEVQGNDGYLLAGQVRRPATQSFDGYVGDGTMTKPATEQNRREFFKFFRKDFFYTVVYIFPNGQAIQRQRGFLVDAPEVEEIYQLSPQYHVALNFEDANYYNYAEDADGNESYNKSATISLSVVDSGGLVFDGYGVVFDEIGAIWEAGGGGGPTTVMVDSISEVSPVWTVTGRTINPQLTNITTGMSITYTGTITETQTLVIDMARRTATLNGTSVIQNVSGDWLQFAPGNNRVTYSTDNASAPASKIEWQEIVG